MSVIGDLVESATDAMVSHAQTMGLFESVNRHEFKNAPAAGGLHGNVWFTRVGPVPRRSGLASTAARLEFLFRIYGSMLAEPQDDIDTGMVKALDRLLAAYSGDFTLDGLVAEVDLLGAYGTALSGQSGYLTLGQQKMRVIDITVPLIINDAWEQVA